MYLAINLEKAAFNLNSMLQTYIQDVEIINNDRIAQ